MSKKFLAFTLIELLVVIAIIGILSGLIIVGMSGMTQKATIAKAQVFSSSLRNSLLMNIVGEWKLDEGGGTAANDTWTKTNNGTLVGFSNTTAGWGDANSSGWMSSSNCISGPCLKFDGVDDYVDCGSNDSSNLGVNMTISAWFKTSTLKPQMLISKSDGTASTGYTNCDYAVYLRTSSGVWDRTYFVINQTAVATASINIINNNWNNIVVTYDGNISKIYINGIVQGENTISISYTNHISSLRIGQHGNATNSTFAFQGSIDDVRIYNAAMPTSRIREQYYAGLNNLLVGGQIEKEEYQQRVTELQNKTASR